MCPRGWRCNRWDRSPAISWPGFITPIPIRMRSFWDWWRFTGGTLLLFRKTALLGAALMLPVMTNILMINMFFVIGLGALCTSTFIFVSMLAVLWYHRRALVGVFWNDQASEPANLRRYYRITAAVVVLLVMTWLGLGLLLAASSGNSK